VHSLSSAFVLGYHGCDRPVAERLLAGEAFKPSENDYDWLGLGIYFWEANPKRGLEFAQEASFRLGGEYGSPAVVGAVVDLGLCLDLTTTTGIQQLEIAFAWLVQDCAVQGDPLPENGPHPGIRKLDCAVIGAIHDIRRENGFPPVDTIKGVFIEGAPVYPTAGFNDRTHVQICVRNADCIKGVFRVPDHALT
jgi:hypothetical protein